MNHQRTKFAKELIKQFKTIHEVNNRVFLNRTTPIQNDSLPSIEVFYVDEDHEKHANSPVEWMRTMNFIVEIKADGHNDIDLTENLDDVSDQVEQILIAQDESDCPLKGADQIQWSGVTFEFDGNGEKPIGSAKLTIGVEYNTKRKEEPRLDDLKKVNAEWNINKDNDDDPPDVADRPLTEAEDCIDKLDE